MAGDWIKMRCDLASDPAVIGIAEKTGLDEDHVVGKLHRLWSWADAHTKDGNAAGVTPAWVDRYLRVEGFATAMQDVGWLALRTSGICFPKFDRHCSETAKTRALTAKRVEKHKLKKGNAEGNADSVSEALPREEKKREDSSRSPPSPPKGGIMEFLPASFDTPDFKAAWLDWLDHRQALRVKAYTPQGLRQLAKKLAEWGPARAIAAIRHSIGNNWQGIFEERSNANGTGGSVGRLSRVEDDGQYDDIGTVIKTGAAASANGAKQKMAAKPGEAGLPDPGRTAG